MASEATRGTGRVAARGAGVVAAGQVVRFVLQIAGLAVLARLLEPADFGLVAMVTVVVGVGQVLRDSGLSSAAVQSLELTRYQRSNLFWINTAIGVVLTTVLWLGADVVAAVYGNAAVADVVRAVSPALLLSALATQYRADLNRRLAFGSIAMADVAAQAVALGTAIAVASAGYGYWALVAQQLVHALVSLAVLAGRGRWLPAWPRRGQGMGGLLRFGGNILGTQLLNYASANVDTLVIGRVSGAGAVGVYNRAFQLLMLPLTQINAPATTVALPILSRSQLDPERFATLLVRCQTVLLNAVLAAVAACFALAPVAVEVVLGAGWADVIPLFRILCLAGVFQAAGYVTYWSFVSLGLTGSHLRYTLVVRPLLIVMVVLGSQWGAVGVAWAYGLGLMLMYPLALWWLRRNDAVPVRVLLRGFLVPFAVYGLAAAAGAWLVAVVPAPLLVRGLVGAAGLLAVVGVAALLVRPFRDALALAWDFVARAARLRS